MLYYKYMKAHRALQLIEEKRIKLTRIDELNDPFEVRPSKLSNTPIEQVVDEYLKNYMDEWRFVCLSETWQEPAMWAHYANSHSGICVGFEIECNPEPVNYSKTRVTLDEDTLWRCMKEWKREIEGLPASPVYNVLQDKVQQQFLALSTTTSDSWAYEKEWRLFVSKRIWKEEDGHCFVDFSQENKFDVKEVTVGMKCSEEETRKVCLTDVDVFAAIPSSDKYRMEREPLERAR